MAGADGFTRTHDMAIVASWVVNLAWVIWLAVVARRAHNLEPAALGDEGRGRRDA